MWKRSAMRVGNIPAEEGVRGEYIYFQCSTGITRGASSARPNASAESARTVRDRQPAQLRHHLKTCNRSQRLATANAGAALTNDQRHTIGLNEVRRSMDNLLDTVRKSVARRTSDQRSVPRSQLNR
jgi:hypothetical protein